jgi:superoxide dismutase, Fe-Mn family
MNLSRRQLLLGIGTISLAAITGITPDTWAQETKSERTLFTLPPLPYAYDALEPYIDRATMQFHHDKHHAAYVNALNAAFAKYPQLEAPKSLEALVTNIDRYPEAIRTTIRNNGGGHLNHSMFWQIMGAAKSEELRKPTGAIAEEINSTFGSFTEFKNLFSQAGMSRFGSGWAWLVRNKAGKLQVVSTANQDSPLINGEYPILGNDVWEHAYYLNYQNRRADYLKAWWNVVNWEEVNKRYIQSSIKA